MIIKGFEKLSLSDFPGHLSCVIFTPGCSLACPFCHNRDLVKNSSKLNKISENEVFEFLDKRKNILDGVVITGGEPTLQKDLVKFIKKIKKLGYKVKLDSNGTRPEILKTVIPPTSFQVRKHTRNLGASKLTPQCHPEAVSKPAEGSLPFTDFLAIDIKTILNAKEYGKFGLTTGISPILESLKLAGESNIPLELRTTVVPKLHQMETIEKMALQLSKIFADKIKRSQLKWILQTFRPGTCLEEKYNNEKPYSSAEMQNLIETAKPIFPVVSLR